MRSGRSSWWWSRGTYGEHVKSELARRAIQLIVEKALEARVRDTLGRGNYERCGGSDPRYRDGHRESGLKSAEVRSG